ncbi:MAG TPA: hypothetical protein PLS50_07055, partial [Candidatus Dojkabacteria bacterium]|nr:hypothetical protein [Candidatus Dojkabacteria bacterium]
MVFSWFVSFGTAEYVEVGTPNGPKSDPKDVGYVPPCSSQIFTAHYIAPGDSYPYQILWYVNGVLVGSNNYELQWQISTSPVSVYFKISYQFSGGHTEEEISPAFNLLIKYLDFAPNISASTSSPAYGCTNEVSFSLPETPCNGSFCGLPHNVNGYYNITWQAPSGWILTSSTNKGSDVTFTPDPFTEGDITATIHYTPCDFQETRIIHITRPKKVPEFTKSKFEGCTSGSVQVSILPICGAVDYTYSIVGNPAITFTTNGLQTLTTTQTSVSVALSGGSS